jgi:N-methylhydantoinase B/oxoprolinase/acetone carboxylase alpha subunit
MPRAGQYRGALAQVREIRLLEGDAVLQIRSDKREHPPFGLHGGRPGTPSSNILNADSETSRELPTMGMAPIVAGDSLRHVMAAGATRSCAIRMPCWRTSATRSCLWSTPARCMVSSSIRPA